MIRINLHPVRAQKKAQAGRRQLLVFVLVIVFEVALMALLMSWQSASIDEKQQLVNELTLKIEQLKKEVGDFDQLKAQRERLIAQRNIINTLQKARTGPVWMMREMSEILTRGKGPSVDQTQYEMLLRKDPGGGFNPRWEPNRLWIDGFSEHGGQIHLSGRAKDYDDVAEFNKRISLSKHFTQDFLERNDQIFDQGLGLKVVKFSLRCRTTY